MRGPDAHGLRLRRAVLAVLICLAAAVGAASIWNGSRSRESAPSVPATTLLVAPFAPLTRVPVGTAPDSGWPTLVLLHGRGSSAERMLELADVARDVGMAVIVPTGPLRMGDARYEWSMDLEAMHLYLERAAHDGALLGAWRSDRTRCYLGGFSQGGSLALALAALRPDSYRGVLAISPVMAAQPRVSAPAPAQTWILVGTEDAVARRAANDTARSWREAGWPIQIETHAGGHQPPDDWPERVRRAALGLLRAKGP